MRALLPSLLAPALLLAPAPVTAGSNPAGATLEDAAVADVTEAGFDALSDALPALVGELVGTAIPLEDFETEIGEFLGCAFGASIAGLDVALTINDAELHSQSPDRLLLDLTVTLSINSSADPFQLYVGLTDGADWWCFLGELVSFTCDAYVDPTSADLSATLSVALVGGALDLSLVSLEQSLTSSLVADDMHLPGCDLVESLLDLLWPFLVDYLEGFIDDELGAMIEESLAGAIPALAFEDQTELLGTTLQYSLVASSLTVGTDKLRIGLDASFDAAPAACVEAFDPGGSASTGDGTIPGPFTTVPSSGDPFALDVLLDDDLANNALYVLWRGGVLCYVVDEDTIGIPLDTNLLSALLLSSENIPWLLEVFDFESQPIVIRTVPTVPPTATFGGGHAVDAFIESLDLEFYAWTRDRWARVVTIRTDIAAGLDFDYDVTTGALALVVDLDTSSLTGTVVYNEMRPWLNEDIEAHFSTAIGSLVDPLIGSLLGDLSFTLPAIYGVKLATMEFEPVGSAGDWLAGFADLTYDPALADAGCDSGCGEDGSCSSGCDSGCDAQATPAQRAEAAAFHLLAGLGAAGLVIRRRRR